MTVKEARAMIARSRKDRRAITAISKVNPSLTHVQALNVLEAAIAGRSDEADLDGERGGLMARNIRRECAW